MHKFLLLVLVVNIAVASWGQLTPADSLIMQFKQVNASVAGPSPAPGKHLLLPNRALNIFLSEAAGYYMSESDNFTLYKNSVVADAAERSFSLYHNMREPAGIDTSVRSFTSVGAKAYISGPVNAASGGITDNNRFGFQLKQTWIGKRRVSATPVQVKAMDAIRANILHAMEMEIRKKAADEELALLAIDSTIDIPGQNPAAARDIARQKFYKDLQLQAGFDFANNMSEALHRTFNYRVMAFNFTSASIYIPLVTENFKTASMPGANPVNRHAYPLHINVTHTRLWMGNTFGRIFLNLAGDVSLNNARDGYMLTKSDELYTGNYTTFVTPAVKAQFIYIPLDWHIGISFLAQQSIGNYHPLNAILGFPITLINKVEVPLADMEFQVRFYDLNHSIGTGKGLAGRTSIGVTFGVPFSKISF